MNRLSNLSPLNFNEDARAKVKTGREKRSKEEKFKVLLRKQIEQIKQGKI